MVRMRKNSAIAPIDAPKAHLSCVVLTALVVLCADTKLVAGQDQEPARSGEALVVADLVERFLTATVTGTPHAGASARERSDGVARPGIFLHPLPDRQVECLFEPIALPPGSLFLVFGIGFRDGIPWEQGPNGARFIVAIDGEVVHAASHRGDGWRTQCVDLSKYAGREVSVALRTEAIDGNTSYDWCVFAQPLVLRASGAVAAATAERSGELGLSEAGSGLALVRVRASGEGRASLTFGATAWEESFDAGEHLRAVRFESFERLKFLLEGSVDALSVTSMKFASQVRVERLELSSPLVHAESSVDVLIHLRNRGLGASTRDARLSFAARLPSGGSEERQLAMGRLAPDERRILRVRDLRLRRSGSLEVRAGEIEPLRAHVFDPPPRTWPTTREAGARKVPSLGRAQQIVLTSGAARIRLVGVPGRDAYGLVDAWTGSRWARVGSLYPLAELWSKRSGSASKARLVVDEFHVDKSDAVISGRFVDGNAESAISVRLGWSEDAARLRWQVEATAQQDMAVRHFAGPQLLAGDGAFGAAKDFAIFPGLEFLEGDEESSSTRDLVYPLSERRVPGLEKIATPLMAVTGDDTLLAMLWKPNAQWARGRANYAAHFNAPEIASGASCVRMSLAVPPVGEERHENERFASRPVNVAAGDQLSINGVLVVDHASNYSAREIGPGTARAGLVLQAMRHWFDLYDIPDPPALPRSWDDEKALCVEAYFERLWQEEPAAVSHCIGWPKGPFVGHAVPLLLVARDSADLDDTGGFTRSDIEQRVQKLIDRVGPAGTWTPSGCHIVLGELPFYVGGVSESLSAMRASARGQLASRKDGLWRWAPRSEKHASLGTSGDHTLGQAARPTLVALRAARLSGDRELAKAALEARKQMDLYAVPRGAQMWECPLYQPDILAAAYAIRAECEAYRLTGEREHLDRARYWAWTGMPFFYTWELPGRAAMPYNVVSVIGSTFHTHSWLGLPVVWCGLVYAYALQDFAEFDDSFPWLTIATGITRSAMVQQYTSGPSRGAYPDSWDIKSNEPRPADINPENILMNALRLRGQSPEIAFTRLSGANGAVYLNAAGSIESVQGDVASGALSFALVGADGFDRYALLAPVEEPREVLGPHTRVENSAALRSAASGGWYYDAATRSLVFKTQAARAKWQLRW